MGVFDGAISLEFNEACFYPIHVLGSDERSEFAEKT